jgi:hypothetical protein
MNDRSAPVLLETMDSCRISWGRVTAIAGPELVVERRAIVLRAGKLTLSDPCPARVLRQLGGLGFADTAAPGDYVSIHWTWACEVLTPAALQRLMRSNQHALRLANETL